MKAGEKGLKRRGHKGTIPNFGSKAKYIAKIRVLYYYKIEIHTNTADCAGRVSAPVPVSVMVGGHLKLWP